MSTFKRVLASIGIVLLCTLLVLGALVMVARSARVQTAAASVLAEQLSRALGARVEVGTLDYKFPNRLLVQDVLIEDQQRDTMLFVDTLSARADLLKYLRDDTLCIRQVALSGGYLDIHHINYTDTAPLNCQFLIDALSSKEPREKKPLGINLQVQGIALNELYLNYCDWSGYLPSARAHLRDISASNIDAEIESLSLYTEHGGYDLDIDNLEARVILNDTLVTFPKLRIRMPNSDFHVEQLTLDRAEVKRLAEAAREDSAALAHTWARTGIALRIDDATVTPSDFAAVIPALRSMRAPWALSANVDGRIDSLEASSLSLKYNGRPILQGNVTALGLPVADSLYLRAQVQDLTVNRATLQDIVSGATGRPVQLPEMLARLGQVHYRGSLEGRLEDLNLRGAFTSALGSIRTDGHASAASDFSSIDFKGTVSTRRFELGRLLGQSDMGNIALNVKVDGVASSDKPFSGNICSSIDNFTYRDYTYRDIHVDGNLHNKVFDGLITSSDPNISFRFLGKADLKKADPLYDFALRLEHFRPGQLHLSEKYADSDLSLALAVELEGSTLDALHGTIDFDSIRFLRSGGRSFFIRDLLITAENNSQSPTSAQKSESALLPATYYLLPSSNRRLSIQSDYVNACVWGDFSYSSLPTSVLRCIARYVPHAFSTDRERELRNSHPSNQLEFYLYGKNLNEICDVLELPVSPHEMSTVKGSLSDADGNILLRAYIPDMYAANQHLENVTLSLDNAAERLNLALFGLRHHSEVAAGKHMGDLRYYVNAHAVNDSIHLGLNWTNPDTIHNGGDLQLTTTLARYANKPLITCHIHPSQFLLADSLWNVYDSRIIYSAADTAIQVDEFLLSSAHQSIYANGIVSRHASDSIYAELQAVDLDYLLGALTNVHNAIWFGGTVTGWATGYGLLSSPMFEANVEMLNGQINGHLLGDVYASAMLDRESKSVLIQGDVYDRRLPAVRSSVDALSPRRVFSDKPYPAGYSNLLPVNSNLPPLSASSAAEETLPTSHGSADRSQRSGDKNSQLSTVSPSTLQSSNAAQSQTSAQEHDSALLSSTFSLLPKNGVRGSGRHTVHLDGEVGGAPGRWGLKIYPDSADIGFVDYWVGSFMADLQGRGSGEVFVRGGKQNGTPYTCVTLRAKGHDAAFTLPFTGGRYILNDSILMDSTSISFGSGPEGIVLHDVEGNAVDFRGAVTHDGRFDDIRLNLTAVPHHAIVLDLPEASNDFYGRVYADGTATVTGTSEEIYVTADATTAPRSVFTLSLSNASNASNASFIEFVDHSKNTLAPVGERDGVRGSSDTKVYLDLRIGVTPQATVSVLLDRQTGDCLRGRGEGDIRFTYATFENQMQMFGSYILQSGTFGFTFQNVIRKEFQIAEGSSVTWNGVPEEPIVDVRALYHTTASLRDLFGSDASAVTNRSNVPVNCVLSLSDRLSNPVLHFGIELPQSDESTASQVRSVINTDEMLMRQVLYLLVFNRFYTPDYLRSESTAGVQETYSLISSTVTGQINSWLSKLTDKFTVGFNMRTDGEGSNASQEYEAQFEINPVRGLIINGNFGYRYNDISNQPVYGNLDVEYMLTPNGKLRAKAYTHTVDKYSLRQANTIQGIGFVFKHDFNWPTQQDSTLRAAAKEQKAAARAEKKAAKEQQQAAKSAAKAEKSAKRSSK